MADRPTIKLQGRLRVELADQFGPLREVATADFDLLAPARVTGAGAVATIHIDEHAVPGMIRTASAAFTAALAEGEQPDDAASVATFCEDVLGIRLDPWQRRVLGEWVGARGRRGA